MDEVEKGSVYGWPVAAAVIDEVEALYKDVHQHPELSMQEKRTAGLAAERLQAAGFEGTTGVGDTGVVGVLRNGNGPTVMLRADMDALPVQEQTALPYASTVDGVMHACGHDVHVACLAGAAAEFAAHRDGWQGTVMAVFQPAGGRDAQRVLAFPPHANHVFKEDTRIPAEVASSPGNGYNEPATHLDPESVRTILVWLRTIFGPG